MSGDLNTASRRLLSARRVWPICCPRTTLNGRGESHGASPALAVTHHQGAIEEVRAIEPKVRRPEVKQLAAEIIKAQEAEIRQMREWRRAWFPNAPQAAAPSGRGMAMGGGAMGGMPHGGMPMGGT